MTLALIAIALYLASAGLLARSLAQAGPGVPVAGWLLPAAAVVAHLTVHGLAWHAAGGENLHFFSALSLVGMGMSAVTVLMGLRGRMAALGVIVFPIAAACLLLYGGFGRHDVQALDWRLLLHAWCALLAYATLAVATLLAVLLWVQERALRKRQLRGWLRMLPPLVELETLLFRTISVGFGLLTATLLTGVLFVEDLMTQHLAHKTVFSVLSWLGFGGLLLGRRRYGWRGATAVRWTLFAMAMLVLAFFGTGIVLELILRRR
ncbi:MAG: cytochrome C assembly family protein [Lysobacteraceae bacterium]